MIIKVRFFQIYHVLMFFVDLSHTSPSQHSHQSALRSKKSIAIRLRVRCLFLI